MAVTIQQIADACGISRGTVDRVIHKRGHVRPQTEQLVMMTAERLGYRPSRSKMLVQPQQRCIGVLLCSQGNPFYDQVLQGVAQARSEMQDYGVMLELRTMQGYDVQRQLELIDQLALLCDVLVLNPCDHPDVVRKVKQLQQQGVETFTVNTDLPSSGRLCYIGSNARKGGETACGMLAMITGGRAQVGIVSGSPYVLGHRQRAEGFCDMARAVYTGLVIAAAVYGEDDDTRSYDVTCQMLQEHPDINALFITAGGVRGVCDAVMASGREQIPIVCFDSTPYAAEMMKRGLIKAMVCQHPYTQGYKSVMTAFHYLVSGVKPNKDKMLVKNEIIIKENLL